MINSFTEGYSVHGPIKNTDDDAKTLILKNRLKAYKSEKRRGLGNEYEQLLEDGHEVIGTRSHYQGDSAP